MGRKLLCGVEYSNCLSDPISPLLRQFPSHEIIAMIGHGDLITTTVLYSQSTMIDTNGGGAGTPIISCRIESGRKCDNVDRSVRPYLKIRICRVILPYPTKCSGAGLASNNIHIYIHPGDKIYALHCIALQFISSHLIPSHLISSHLISSHLISFHCKHKTNKTTYHTVPFLRSDPLVRSHA